MRRSFHGAVAAVLILVGITGTQAGAHGDDRPGPNGGLMFMPGPFHVELVDDTRGGVMLFLLDMEFKNPVTKNSSVQVRVTRGSKSTDLPCMVMGSHFHCTGKNSFFNKGELKVTALREGVKGNVITSKWPLPAPPKAPEGKAGSAPASSGHDGH